MRFVVLVFNETAATWIYAYRRTLALPDALPICFLVVLVLLNLLALLVVYFGPVLNLLVFFGLNGYLLGREYFELVAARRARPGEIGLLRRRHRSEEHTSEPQSLMRISYAVFCLKKKILNRL